MSVGHTSEKPLESKDVVDTSRISFTAQYTGYVWKQNKLAESNLATSRGWLLYQMGRPFNYMAEKAMEGRSLETFLVERHRWIDRFLREEIESGRISQVIEIAAGLSPRGEKFMKRYGVSHGLLYIESDLPAVIETKRQLLSATHPPMEGHILLPINALVDESPHSLERVAAQYLDPKKGCVIITEGLLSYLTTEQLHGLWRRIAKVLSGCTHGVYMTDLHLDEEQPKNFISRLIRQGIELSVRGKLHIHFAQMAAAEKALVAAGFTQFELHRTQELLRILRARV